MRESSNARVTSIKSQKEHGLSDGLTDKARQLSDLGPVKRSRNGFDNLKAKIFEMSLSTLSLISGGTDCQLGAKIKDKGNCPTSKRETNLSLRFLTNVLSFR